MTGAPINSRGSPLETTQSTWLAKAELQELRGALLTAIGAVGSAHKAERSFAERINSSPALLQARARRMARVVVLLNGERQILLDAGSGIGLNAVLALRAGADQVYAVELSDSRSDVAMRLFEQLRVGDRILLFKKDVLSLDMPECSLGGVYSTEFLEHISDSRAYHELAFRWLMPGGRIYCRTGANGANIVKAAIYRRRWRAVDAAQYGRRRAALARQVSPKMPDGVLGRFVNHTWGYVEEEVVSAARMWQLTGQMPQPRSGAPRNPTTGVYYERLRGPVELVREMREVGFEAECIKPDFTNISRSSVVEQYGFRALGRLIGSMHPASVVVAPWLEALGRRPC